MLFVITGGDAANAARAPPFATMLFVITGGDSAIGVDD